MAVTWFVSLGTIYAENQIRKSLVEQGLALSNKAVQENNKKIQKRVIDNFELSLMKKHLNVFPV